MMLRVLRFDLVNDKAIASWIHDANGEHVEIAGDAGTGGCRCLIH